MIFIFQLNQFFLGRIPGTIIMIIWETISVAPIYERILTERVLQIPLEYFNSLETAPYLPVMDVARWVLREPGISRFVQSIRGRNDVLRSRQEQFNNPGGRVLLFTTHLHNALCVVDLLPDVDSFSRTSWWNNTRDDDDDDGLFAMFMIIDNMLRKNEDVNEDVIYAWILREDRRDGTLLV
jgi:hypothetical protein